MKMSACYRKSYGAVRDRLMVFLFAIIAIHATALTGCGGGSGGIGEAEPIPTPTPSPIPTASPTPSPSPSPTPTPTPTPIPITVEVLPQTVTVNVGSTVRFSASVTGATNTSVLWSIAENEGGTISGDGAYIAPTVPGVFHIIATSQADNTRVGQATVTVQSGNATGIIQ